MISLYESILKKSKASILDAAYTVLGKYNDLFHRDVRWSERCKKATSIDSQGRINISNGNKEANHTFHLSKYNGPDFDGNLDPALKFGKVNHVSFEWNGTISDWDFAPTKFSFLELVSQNTFDATCKNLKIDIKKHRLNNDPFEVKLWKIKPENCEFNLGKDNYENDAELVLNIPESSLGGIKSDVGTVSVDFDQFSGYWLGTAIAEIKKGHKTVEEVFKKKNWPNLFRIKDRCGYGQSKKLYFSFLEKGADGIWREYTNEPNGKPKLVKVL